MINPNPKRSDEPIWWTLFGAGGTWFAMITPITVLILGILMPLGIFDAGTFNYMRVHDFASSFWGGLFIVLSLSLPMWHAMHRLHHGMHDLKFHTGTIGKILCYAIAAFITGLSIVFVIML